MNPAYLGVSIFPASAPTLSPPPNPGLTDVVLKYRDDTFDVSVFLSNAMARELAVALSNYIHGIDEAERAARHREIEARAAKYATGTYHPINTYRTTIRPIMGGGIPQRHSRSWHWVEKPSALMYSASASCAEDIPTSRFPYGVFRTEEPMTAEEMIHFDIVPVTADELTEKPQ